MKIPDAKAAVDKEWKNLETIPVRQLEKVKSKKEVILEAQRDKRKVHSATLMVTCLLSVQKIAAKVMDVIARLPGCDGQAADAVSAYTQ